MRKIILMLLATILISVCGTVGIAQSPAAEGQFDAKASFKSSRALLDDCDDKGGTHVNLFYGNFEVRTVGVVRLKKGEIFAIRLKPKNDANNRSGINYETETVTISGKDLASAWLTAVGSYTSTAPDHELVICVPPGTATGTYYYQIYITNTGSLDPRAEVTF